MGDLHIAKNRLKGHRAMHQMTNRTGTSGWGFLLRMRWQLALSLIVAVLLPVMIMHLAIDVPLDETNMTNTAVGGAMAVIIGYVGYRRLQLFPGLAAGGFLLPSFGASFGFLTAALVLFRFDYSRLQLFATFAIAVSFFAFVHLRYVAKRTRIFAVVPGGETERLPYMPRVIWHRLTSTSEAPTHLNGVVADLRYDHDDAWDSRITQFVLEGIPVYHIKQAVEQLSGRIELEHLSENTLGSINPNDNYIKLKSFLDTLVAIIALTAAAPVMFIVALAIKIDSPGPVIFKQLRTGFRAKPFTVYKFRTMRVGLMPADLEAARVSAITRANDPRITKLGAFLRKSRLDELPQLVNILKGEMSLIGPRPEAVELTRWYEGEISFYHYRHIIKPGVTGWAQITQGHVAEVSEVREKLHLDFYYVKNLSLWLDLLIVLRTIQTMITGHGSR